MVDTTNTLKEIKAIITALKTQADKEAAWTGTDKADIEARINHLNDKTKNHSKSPDKLDMDMKDMDSLQTLIGADKTQWATEKSNLEKAKIDAEKVKNDKEQELIKIKGEVVDKLNADLISGLTTLVNTGLKKPKKKADGTDEKDSAGNIIYEDIFDKTLMDTIKTSVEEIKTKGAKVDLTELQTKLDGIKSKTDTIKEGSADSKEGSNATKYSAITAAILGGLALIVAIYGAFFKKSDEGYNMAKSDEQ